ncbi:MAG: oligopeptide:H+ symporter [Legionellales bacterium]|nr:oligopeptide:H+ symporter [Legionellales bacterium]
MQIISVKVLSKITHIKYVHQIQKQQLLYLVSFAEFWELLSYFGTVAILVLYCQSFDFSIEKSYAIYGIYLALLCGLPVIGGFLSDKFIDGFIALVVGAILLIAGNIILIINNQNYLYLGLAGTICGTSLYKPICTNIVGIIYNNDDNSREKAYSFFYAILNCGAIAGPIVYGIIIKFFGWGGCFLFSAVGLTSALTVMLLMRNRIKNALDFRNKLESKKKHIFFSSVILVYFAVIISFYSSSYFSYILVIALMLAIGTLGKIVSNLHEGIRRGIYGILVLLTFCVFFFLTSFQVGSSITSFINGYVDKGFFGFQIPTSFFTALDPFFVVAFAPIFSLIWSRMAKNNREPTVTKKLIYGLNLGGCGFIAFLFAIKLSIIKAHYWTIIFLVIGYAFIGAGEICLSPAVLSAISQCSPQGISNTMMGLWYFFMAIAGYLSSYIDNLLNYSNSNITASTQISINNLSLIFISMTIAIFFSAIFLRVISRNLTKLLPNI